MLNFFKKLFCKHSYEPGSLRLLRKERRRSGYHVMGLPVYVTYGVYVRTSKCSKCDKFLKEELDIADNSSSSVLY